MSSSQPQLTSVVFPHVKRATRSAHTHTHTDTHTPHPWCISGSLWYNNTHAQVVFHCCVDPLRDGHSVCFGKLDFNEGNTDKAATHTGWQCAKPTSLVNCTLWSCVDDQTSHTFGGWTMISAWWSCLLPILVFPSYLITVTLLAEPQSPRWSNSANKTWSGWSLVWRWESKSMYFYEGKSLSSQTRNAAQSSERKTKPCCWPNAADAVTLLPSGQEKENDPPVICGPAPGWIHNGSLGN